MKSYVCACAMLLAPIGAVAQVAPSPITAPAANTAVLRTGTEIPLRLSEMITTKGKKLKVGQRVHMEVAEPVLVNGVVVIPSGSPAMGEITEVRNKGMWGKSGHFTGRALYATVNGRQLRLTGGFDDKGTTGTVGVVGAVALIPVAGFFMTGTSARLDVGAPVKGFMDEDVQLAMPAGGPGPLVVGAPTPVAVPAPATSMPGTATTTQPAVLRAISTAPAPK